MPTTICGHTEQQPQKTKPKIQCQNSPSAHMPDPTHLITSVSVSPKSCPYHWKRRDKEISLFCVFIFTSDWQKFRVAVSRAFSRFSSVYTLIAGQLCKKTDCTVKPPSFFFFSSPLTTIVSLFWLLLHTTIKKLEDEQDKMCVCMCGRGGGGRTTEEKKSWVDGKGKKGGGGGELVTATVAPILVEFLDCSQTRPSGWPRHLFSKTGLEGIHLYLYLLTIHVFGSRSRHNTCLISSMVCRPYLTVVTNLGLGANLDSVCLEIIPEVRVLRLQLPE